MNCDDIQDKLPRYIGGKLSANEIKELESHVTECARCQRALEELKWFQTGLEANQDQLAVGHIASRLLYSYIDTPNTLQQGTIDFIQSHIDTCGDCREKYDQMKALASTELHVDRTQPVASNGFLAWLKTNPLRWVAVAAAVLVIAVGATYFAGRIEPTAPFAVFSTEDSSIRKYTLIDLPLGPVQRGEFGQRALPIGILEDRTVALRLRVNIFDDDDIPPWIVLKSSDGKVLFKGEIRPLLTDSSTIVLVIDKLKLEPGTYAVQILNIHNTATWVGHIEL